MTVKIKGFSKERENFARECGAVEALVYNDLHDEVHQLGIEQYETGVYLVLRLGGSVGDGYRGVARSIEGRGRWLRIRPGSRPLPGSVSWILANKR